MSDSHGERRPTGEGHVVIGRHPKVSRKVDEECDGYVKSAISDIFFSYPLRLMVPDHASSSTCQWVYPITFGGGLVEGDHIKYNVNVKRGCCALCTTQASTKVYRCPDGRDTVQELSYTLHPGSLLAILPDPLVPFEDACYKQTQHVRMSSDASLVLLDWVTSGRLANGEHHKFTRLTCSNRVDVDEAAVFRDTVRLEDKPWLSVGQAMGRYTVVGSLLMLGKAVEDTVKEVLARHGSYKSYDATYSCELLVGASPLRYCVPGGSTVEGCIVRFSAHETDEMYAALESILAPLFPVLGGNPFSNKY